MTADRNPRQAVAELMVEVHLVSLDYAIERVSEMDDPEIARRWRMYTGMELSTDRRNPKSETDFHPVFGIATATARRPVLNSAPVIPDRIDEARKSLPELETKNRVQSVDGR